jgi:trehalose 6-phosphate synthase
LVNALEPVLAHRGGSWIGWDGISLPSAGAVAAQVANPRRVRTDDGIDLYGVPLSEREVSRYYHGFSNRALWPLFHDRLPTSVFQPEDFAAYARVNRRFAETVVAQAEPHDRVWVHDYHLLMVPGLMRELGYRGRVDFFLHIPFPPPEIFRALPWRAELLKGLLAADTLAFHVGGYRDNFVRVAESLVGARPRPAANGDEIVLEHAGGESVVAAVPIGVDVGEFERVAELPSVAARVKRIKAAHGTRKIIFAADRLDYTKGIFRRFRTLDKYLARRPEAVGTIDMVQIVVPSRHQVEEYRALKRAIDEEAGRINAQYGLEYWIPIRYFYRALDREDLVAHYRAAAVAMVTPLKDGMNLVAPEFVASRTDGDGVLLVSELAGIAERLPGSILVNPYDDVGVAAALDQALYMEEPARRKRMATLRRHVRANPVSRWAEGCLGLGASARLEPVREWKESLPFRTPTPPSREH